MARILKATEENFSLCKEALNNSQVISVPTETVYGLAGNALDETALHSIFKIKGRPLFNPLIIHTYCSKSAEKYAFFNSLAVLLTEKFWPGPLTIILPKKEIVPSLVTANLDSVAIRCPKNQTFLELLKRLSYPLAAPSANPFGYVSPTSAEHVNFSLGDKIKYILDGDNCEIGLESTIVDIRNPDKPKILRPGPISKEQLEECTGIEFKVTCNNSTKELRAPGMCKSHYSPITPLQIISKNELLQLVTSNNDHKVAFILQKRPGKSLHQKLSNVYWLSEIADELQIAQNFYHLLRKTDTMNYKKIYIEEINIDLGYGPALKDRMTKAANK